jgi:hypothetical protein
VFLVDSFVRRAVWAREEEMDQRADVGNRPKLEWPFSSLVETAAGIFWR